MIRIRQTNISKDVKIEEIFFRLSFILRLLHLASTCLPLTSEVAAFGSLLEGYLADLSGRVADLVVGASLTMLST